MAVDGADRLVLITGGAGFIGSNLAERLLKTPKTRVRVFDNLSRAGAEHNLEWLRSAAGSQKLEFIRGDVRDRRLLQEAMLEVTDVFHLAAQVAVTTSVDDPSSDFEVNAQGTLNVLEAARTGGKHPFLLFTSTNKVYGALQRLSVETEGTHYRACSGDCHGVNESEPLDFHSPYGCSKGAADQYVRDYARIYNMPTVVFRMSCIAGPRQFGNEDQGWVAHFLYSVLEGKPISIYGDGFQVRDVLHVFDLIDAMLAVRRSALHCGGEIYNLGGGLERAISVIEMLRKIEARTGKLLKLRYREVRPGDQPWYVADTSKLQQSTGWRPQRTLDQTLDAILEFWTARGKLDTITSKAPVFEQEVA